MAFECALSATRGRRAYQEDAAVFWPGHATFTLDPQPSAPGDGRLIAILADGMGGHAGGAVASETACRICLAGLTDAAGRSRPESPSSANASPLERTEEIDPYPQAAPARHETTLTEPPRPRPVTDPLTAALDAANAAIGATAAADPKLDGMGTTLVATILTPDTLEWISVGDSPLYLFRGGEIALLNEDHSLAPALDQLARDGHITPEAALTDPRRHMLRSALTGEPLDLIDRCRRPLALFPDDIIILASDGLQSLDNDEIARIITTERDTPVDHLADALIRAVEARRIPHQDNATVIVIKKTSRPGAD